MNEQSSLVKIKWLYFSIKEQYKYINSRFNKISQDQIYIHLIEREIKYYKLSLILFKKSLNEFENAIDSFFNQEKIYLIKEVYLRRSLINLRQGLDILLKNQIVNNEEVTKELISLFSNLANSIKDLGLLLERV
jgi:hypothetical protein